MSKLDNKEMDSIISNEGPVDGANTLIKAADLKVHFPIRGGVFHKTRAWIKAVDGVSIHLNPGEIVSVVGESGCGKSTLGNALLGLVKIAGGQLCLEGEKINYNSLKSFNKYRRDFQFIFQDPWSSLNPRHTIYEMIAEPLIVHKIVARNKIKDRVAWLLDRVGLSAKYMDRYPHSFSGGQRQRISIARAIGLEPKAIICDEIVAALDVSVQAQIVNLLLELKEEMNMALLFISHDLSLIRFLSDRVYVMYLGQFVESGTADEVFERPGHPYTQALLDSIPTLDTTKKPAILEGEVPSPVNRPSGCAFHTRCPIKRDDCTQKTPVMEQIDPGSNNATKSGHMAACLYL